MSWADQGRSGYVPPHLRGAGERRRGGGGGGGGCPGALRAPGRPQRWVLAPGVIMHRLQPAPAPQGA